MKAIQLESPKYFVSIDIAIPKPPEAGEVLVATHCMGICGTDVSCYYGRFPFFDYPRIPGHELGVEVIAVGKGVTNVKVGDRCSVEPYFNCGDCYACRHDSGNCCVNLKVLGVMTDGGLCEQFLIRADKLHPSAKLDYEQLALVETLAIGCHALDRGGAEKGDQVLIIGMGPIGLATLEFARLSGAKVSVMDMNASRLRFVYEQYGIADTILLGDDDSHQTQVAQITGGDKYAVVIDATGNSNSMGNALQYVAQTGKLVYVGITTEDVSFKHPALHRPEATILASRNALPADFVKIIKLIESGNIVTKPWITHRIAMDTLANEFEAITNPASGVIKAMISVP